MPLRIALCNEVLRHLPFEEQCSTAAELGYDALELAPFTLGEEPHRLTEAQKSQLRRTLADTGMTVSGFHMLMQKPAGLSISADDDSVASLTREVGQQLVSLCAELGGRYLVHGSAQQRNFRAGHESANRDRALSYFAAMATAASDAGVTYCIEALSPDRTNFITSIAEAVEIVDAIGSPGLRTMLDCSHAARSETDDICTLLRRYVPTGHIMHIHANDPSGRGPGQGSLGFADIMRTIAETGYNGDIGVEPFSYEPDPKSCAADAIGYLRSFPL